MSADLRAAAADYLRTRRARGYQLADHRWLIAAFLDELAARGVTTISVTDAMAFAQARPEITRAGQAARLQAIRGFAAHVHILDPAAAQLIPPGLIAAKVVRRIPYLYSDQQISQLVSAAATLSPPLFGASMATLTGLLAAAGLRSGEAVALDLEDLDQQGLTVTGKYGRKRLVPLHPTTLQALADYQRVRARLTGATPSGPLLAGAKGGRLSPAQRRRPPSELSPTPAPCPSGQAAGHHDCTISGTPSPSTASSTPTGKVPTSTPGSPRWRPTSDTSTRSTPTGT